MDGTIRSYVASNILYTWTQNLETHLKQTIKNNKKIIIRFFASLVLRVDLLLIKKAKEEEENRYWCEVRSAKGTIFILERHRHTTEEHQSIGIRLCRRIISAATREYTIIMLICVHFFFHCYLLLVPIRTAYIHSFLSLHFDVSNMLITFSHFDVRNHRRNSEYVQNENKVNNRLNTQVTFGFIAFLYNSFVHFL